MGGSSAINNNTDTKKGKRIVFIMYTIIPVWVLFSHVILIYKLIKLFTKEKGKANRTNDNFTSTPME